MLRNCRKVVITSAGNNTSRLPLAPSVRGQEEILPRRTIQFFFVGREGENQVTCDARAASEVEVLEPGAGGADGPEAGVRDPGAVGQVQVLEGQRRRMRVGCEDGR